MAEITGAIYKNITASSVIKAEPGKVYGFVVNSNTNGTVKLWDNATAGSGTVIINTYTVPTGASNVIRFPEPINFYNGLYCTVGGTADLTFLYN